MQLRPQALFLLIAGLVLGAGCASTAVEEPDKSPEIEQRAREEREQAGQAKARHSDFNLIRIRLDEAISGYVSFQAQSENPRAERQAESLRSYIEAQAKRFRDDLLADLQDSDPRLRTIAAAALGFGGDQALVDPLLLALSDPVDSVRASACLGLGVLAKVTTPLDQLWNLLLDDKQSVPVRRAAAWVLVKLQLAGAPSAAFTQGLPRALQGDPLTKDDVVLVQCLRGLGLLRNPNLMPAALPYLSHPTPLVRQAALIAVGRCQNREAVPLVLPFLSATEANPNVRLTARKTLKALTGNRIDHEYDVAAWQREFAQIDK
jgi:HEAT repeat protein